MAKIAETKKIREYSDTPIEGYPFGEKQKKSIQTMNALLLFLGIMQENGDGKTKQHFVVQQFILSEYSNYTFEEIIEAFKLAMKGTYEGMRSWKSRKLVAKLDCATLGAVMKSYEEYKRSVYKPKKQIQKKNISEFDKRQSEDRSIKKAKDEWQSTGIVPTGYAYVWDILSDRGLVNTDKDYKLELMKRARIRKSQTTYKTIREAIKPKKRELVSIAKRIGIEDYFKKD